ncbi:glycosyltransferase [Umezakia ovalisporum]|uniref:Glycosyltransferase n=2 Tax=Umezakia ovalisporum TaxID=75695 RepID=A0AA43H1N4_9CYAN|nr:glycosyltransferase [Umezakia ovalisporum]MDH6056197.1 glycosyltransferase [Umezakia ovalisporum FSS-43]MDH6065619.1 glycosyltransferase [Umezakia ovalisporum FSS-62]MDH6065864.1 glycosyltransferase [Umezakia ovalisporum APH033B]MDH6072110.1 glycosyltransferase [Umezakia ovalisporum CobakiLakeA]MDH6074003.1 glycosyltransferase [Umezakia ovalisporum CS-1034]
MRILCVSTPVGFLGSGEGGGLELTVRNVVHSLSDRNHSITIIAPQGSQSAHGQVIEVGGEPPPLAQLCERTTPVSINAGSVLGRMWEVARELQSEFDILLNFAYDWLPFYLTPFFHRPVAHLVCMGSLSTVMDEVINAVALRYPGTIAVRTRAQAQTFPFASSCRCLPNGLDLTLYQCNLHPQEYLGWMGRISPEKGLEDAIAAVNKTQIPLKIWGKLQNSDYWQWIKAQFPSAPFSYEGFLPTSALQEELGKCRGLLMTHRWVEAFGNVCIEALACGVPVIAYSRGGPSEIVHSGKTGWLVEPDSVNGLVEAIAKLGQINRSHCREEAEASYSLAGLGERFETWLNDCLAKHSGAKLPLG